MIRILATIPYHVSCDACGYTIHRHAIDPLSLRGATEAEGWQWVVTDGRMEHVCPACGGAS